MAKRHSYKVGQSHCGLTPKHFFRKGKENWPNFQFPNKGLKFDQEVFLETGRKFTKNNSAKSFQERDRLSKLVNQPEKALKVLLKMEACKSKALYTLWGK